MNNSRVLGESWRGEGGRKVIDFKSDGKTHWSQEGAATVSTDTGAPAASKNNGINSWSDLNTFCSGNLNYHFLMPPDRKSKFKMLANVSVFLPTTAPLSLHSSQALCAIQIMLFVFMAAACRCTHSNTLGQQNNNVNMGVHSSTAWQAVTGFPVLDSCRLQERQSGRWRFVTANFLFSATEPPLPGTVLAP